MHEERLLNVGVECYAGHRGEQTPRTLILGDRRIDVAEVLDAWLAPDSFDTMSDPAPGS
jgi:hypothetical protein